MDRGRPRRRADPRRRRLDLPGVRNAEGKLHDRLPHVVLDRDRMRRRRSRGAPHHVHHQPFVRCAYDRPSPGRNLRRARARRRCTEGDVMIDLATSASVTIDAPIDEVWNALTTPELIKRWFFGVDTETDWQVGSPLVHRGEWQGKPYEDKGTILAFDRPTTLAHTHWS